MRKILKCFQVICIFLMHTHGLSEEHHGGTCTCTHFACPKLDNTNEKLHIDYKTLVLHILDKSFALKDLVHTNCTDFFYGDKDHCPKLVTNTVGDCKYIHGTNNKVFPLAEKPFKFLQTRHSRSDADTAITSDFFGDALYIGKELVFNFTCKLFQTPADSSMMFLVNEKTVDILRSVNSDCYNIEGKYTERSCSCSLQTNTFRWVFSSTPSLQILIFQVQARFSNTTTGHIVRVSLSRTFDGKHFGPLNSKTKTIRSALKETERTGYTESVFVPAIEIHTLALSIATIIGLIAVLLLYFNILYGFDHQLFRVFTIRRQIGQLKKQKPDQLKTNVPHQTINYIEELKQSVTDLTRSLEEEQAKNVTTKQEILAEFEKFKTEHIERFLKNNKAVEAVENAVELLYNL